MKTGNIVLVAGGVGTIVVAGVVLAARFAPRRIDDLPTPVASALRQRLPEAARARLSAVMGDGAGERTGEGRGAGATPTHAASRADARYIGNTQTRVYHEASDANLPAEDHRAYFASTEEAEAIGYRAAGHTA